MRLFCLVCWFIFALFFYYNYEFIPETPGSAWVKVLISKGVRGHKSPTGLYAVASAKVLWHPCLWEQQPR